MSESPFYNGCAIVDRSDLEKLKVTGPRAAWFLDQLLTSAVEKMPAGAWTEALLLTPKGRITAYLQVANVDDTFLVSAIRSPDTPPLADFLGGRVFTTPVEIEDVSEGLSMLTLLGPGSFEVCNVLTGVSPAAGESVRAREEFIVSGIDKPLAGFDVWLPASAFDEAVALLTDQGAVTATAEQYAEVCAANGYPVFGVDFDDTFLPQEAALERAVAFDKGCYLGQESVAMAQRGRVKRRLRHLEFKGAALAGTVESDDAKDKGTVTSVGSSPLGSFGVGAVATDVQIGDTVSVHSEEASASAVVRDLPGTTTGPARPSARELRERLRDES